MYTLSTWILDAYSQLRKTELVKISALWNVLITCRRNSKSNELIYFLQRRLFLILGFWGLLWVRCRFLVLNEDELLKNVLTKYSYLEVSYSGRWWLEVKSQRNNKKVCLYFEYFRCSFLRDHWLYFLMNLRYSSNEILPLWSVSILLKFHCTISSVIGIFKGLKVSSMSLLNSLISIRSSSFF